MRRLRAVAVVTPEHGETFAREWVERALAAMDLMDAFVEAGVVLWPFRGREAQAVFHDIEDEIVERTLKAVQPAIAEAFVAAANEVLARERRRRHPVVTR